MTTIRNIFFLLFAIIIAFLGIRFSIYGLIVSIIDNDLHELSVDEINYENLKTKRYIKVINGFSVNTPLEYIGDEGEVQSYIYPLFYSNMTADSTFNLSTNILIESTSKINNWDKAEISGLLKPYWHKIDNTIISEFNYIGIKVDKNGYYLELDTKPLKWYWYVLVLMIAGLFFYRMIEAIINGVKKKKATAIKA